MVHDRLQSAREKVQRKTKSVKARRRAKERKKRKSRERVEANEPETAREEARAAARQAKGLKSDITDFASEFGGALGASKAGAAADKFFVDDRDPLDAATIDGLETEQSTDGEFEMEAGLDDFGFDDDEFEPDEEFGFEDGDFGGDIVDDL